MEIEKKADLLIKKIKPGAILNKFDLERLTTIGSKPANFFINLKDHKERDNEGNYLIRPIASVHGTPIDGVDYFIQLILKQALKLVPTNIISNRNIADDLFHINRLITGIETEKGIKILKDISRKDINEILNTEIIENERINSFSKYLQLMDDTEYVISTNREHVNENMDNTETLRKEKNKNTENSYTQYYTRNENRINTTHGIGEILNERNGESTNINKDRRSPRNLNNIQCIEKPKKSREKEKNFEVKYSGNSECDNTHCYTVDTRKYYTTYGMAKNNRKRLSGSRECANTHCNPVDTKNNISAYGTEYYQEKVKIRGWVETRSVSTHTVTLWIQKNPHQPTGLNII